MSNWYLSSGGRLMVNVETGITFSRLDLTMTWDAYECEVRVSRLGGVEDLVTLFQGTCQEALSVWARLVEQYQPVSLGQGTKRPQPESRKPAAAEAEMPF